MSDNFVMLDKERFFNMALVVYVLVTDDAIYCTTTEPARGHDPYSKVVTVGREYSFTGENKRAILNWLQEHCHNIGRVRL